MSVTFIIQSHFVYYESIKRELKIRCIYECRCDERLQTTLTRQAFRQIKFLRLKIEESGVRDIACFRGA